MKGWLDRNTDWGLPWLSIAGFTTPVSSAPTRAQGRGSSCLRLSVRKAVSGPVGACEGLTSAGSIQISARRRMSSPAQPHLVAGNKGQLDHTSLSRSWEAALDITPVTSCSLYRLVWQPFRLRRPACGGQSLYTQLLPPQCLEERKPTAGISLTLFPT